MTRWLFLVSGLSVLLLASAGCSSNPNHLQKVSGERKFKGQPLDRGLIQFIPEANSGYVTQGGAVIRNGKYEVPAAKGLAPGRYLVVISSADAVEKEEAAPGISGPEFKDRIPAKYNTESQEYFEVKAGLPNAYNCNIE